jgi:hypothetical protein
MVGLEVTDPGSTAARRFISRLMAAVVRLTWPLIKTRKRLE